jgi:polysaccharide deacetylase 2 family uncharacterized protein YibQ
MHLLRIAVVMIALVALGYYIGNHRHSASLTPPKRTLHPTVRPPSTPKVSDTAPIISTTDLLRYGEMEDAQGDTLPDISWYEPSETSTDEKPTKTPASSPTPAQPVDTPSDTPRLVIIIDDVAHASQLKAIQALPYRITPSIFPPSEISHNSHTLAVGLEHYMIHLPLESGSKAMNRMQGMLFVRDSRAKVEARVRAIRRLFPTGHYINNHTGSVFTADYRAMKRLYGLLRRAGFVFVDSRTTPKSTVRRITREYGDRYIRRDIFIDNVQKRSAILKQLKKAVRIARKRGFAIAIGHPHKATLDALRHAQTVLKGVQTVYLDELYPLP